MLMTDYMGNRYDNRSQEEYVDPCYSPTMVFIIATGSGIFPVLP